MKLSVKLSVCVLQAALQAAGITRQLLRRQEELLIDIDIPVRVGLRVVVSEWFRRSRRKNGWPDVSAGAIGTITRLVRVRHFNGRPKQGRSCGLLPYSGRWHRASMLAAHRV